MNPVVLNPNGNPVRMRLADVINMINHDPRFIPEDKRETVIAYRQRRRQEYYKMRNDPERWQRYLEHKRQYMKKKRKSKNSLTL